MKEPKPLKPTAIPKKGHPTRTFRFPRETWDLFDQLPGSTHTDKLRTLILDQFR